MAIALSQADYWELLQHSSRAESQSSALSDSESCWSYPSELGQGYRQEIEFQEGLQLEIVDCQLQDILQIRSPERPHPLEYSFLLAGSQCDQQMSVGPGEYVLYGSGIAPEESYECSSRQFHTVTVHIDPNLFRTLLGKSLELASSGLHDLMQEDQPYSMRSGGITPTMRSALQQILECPYRGVTRHLFLEGKVLELMALIIDDQLSSGPKLPDSSPNTSLKSDDIERIHQARDILQNRLDNPPSLIELARQVGLNDCTLKRGFRQVFGTTAFGYLHQHRLEQARHLLETADMNVTEVAHAVGFANRGYFAAAFRKQFGVNPREYRATRRYSA